MRHWPVFVEHVNEPLETFVGRVWGGNMFDFCIEKSILLTTPNQFAGRLGGQNRLSFIVTKIDVGNNILIRNTICKFNQRKLKHSLINNAIKLIFLDYLLYMVSILINFINFK